MASLVKALIILRPISRLPAVLSESLVDDSFVDTAPEFRFRTRFYRTFDPKQKVIVSRRTAVPPKLDGMMNDACWQFADHTRSAFVQIKTKTPTRKQTVVYVCHDDNNLYMAYVAEEPETKTVRMASKRTPGVLEFSDAYYGDAAEVFLEIGGVGGEGKIHQFIFNIYPQVKYDGLDPYDPTWFSDYQLLGVIGAKRWIVEVAYPFDGFKSKGFEYRGPPKRGEIWGIRCIRDGKPGAQGEDRMMATWTYNPMDVWHVPYPTGVLVFEERNILRNGGLNEDKNGDAKLDYWGLVSSEESVKASLAFDEKAGFASFQVQTSDPEHSALITQPMGLRENTFYRVTAKLRVQNSQGKVFLGIDQPLNQETITAQDGWLTHSFDFFTNAGQGSANVFLMFQGQSGTVDVDEIRVEQLVYGVEKGMICLTNNSPREDLNVKVDGRYSYIEPGTDKELFPKKIKWTQYWINGKADKGGATGWIPFDKGTLTSIDRDYVEWPTKDHILAKMYPKGHDIIFDLGKDFFVRRVDVMPAKPIDNVIISMKPEKLDEYILSYKMNGTGVLNPPGPSLYAKCRGLDSVARYVKVHFMERGRGGGGIHYIRIWGEEKGDRTEKDVTRFRWKRGLVVKETKFPQFRKLDKPFILPEPQTIEWTNERFVLNDGVAVVAKDVGKGLSTARQVVEELDERFGIKARLVKETDNPPAKGIFIGEPEHSPLIARLVREEGLKVDSANPGEQGYELLVHSNRIVIAGSDQAGTFFGVQSLMQIVQQRREGTFVAGAKIRDWPYMLYRAPFYYMSRSGMLPIYKRMLKAMARLKVNVVIGAFGHTEYGQVSPGNRGLSRYEAEELLKFADEHFIDFEIFYGRRTGGGSDCYERHDDEDLEHLSKRGNFARVNGCPSNPKHLQAWFDAIDRTCSAVPTDRFNVNMDEMSHENQGARWLADRRCLIRELNGGQVFGEYITRLYDHNRRRHRKTDVLDTMLTVYGNAYHQMWEAYPLIPRDMGVEMWKGALLHKGSDPEYGINTFERAFGINSTGKEARGKVNEYYNIEPGRRIWGRQLATWGAGNSEALQLGFFGKGWQVGFNTDHIVVFADQTWSPDRPTTHEVDFAQRIGNAMVRLRELIDRVPFPSWRDDTEKHFFNVNLRPFCNWSQIDKVPNDGYGWQDWGPNYDLRRMPKGKVEFCGIPFEVLDPAKSGGKSIIMISNPTDQDRTLDLPPRAGPILVNRKAASLIFLRACENIGKIPSYRIHYEGGRYLTAAFQVLSEKRAGMVHTWNRSNNYALPASAKPDAGGNSYIHNMVKAFSYMARPAWIGQTPSGDEATIYLHEWVNPYPELTITGITVWWPEVRKGALRECIFAITALEPTVKDLAFWSNRFRFPLQNDETLTIGNSKPYLAGGKLTNGRYVNEKGELVAQITPGAFSNVDKLFDNIDNNFAARGIGPALPLTINFPQPQSLSKLAVRTRFYRESRRPSPEGGTRHFLHTDYKVEVTGDGSTWQPIAEVKGTCGEDGSHLHALPSTPIKSIRITLNALPYQLDYEVTFPGLSFVQVYRTGK